MTTTKTYTIKEIKDFCIDRDLETDAYPIDATHAYYQDISLKRLLKAFANYNGIKNSKNFYAIDINSLIEELNK